ncbi:phycobiliprotein lyase [Aphanothece hegewaldii CCALA 016]|uniref:Chromophore lyase CpcS/CpeS n=1 Tax=Aphanothece hegewaldii CCALA 016 TaxID=2107694 RepID=A0A2T1LY12_9CHRO|nr:phycobiliprotein lyase [Aphanothece hegewaldii]PSF37273.1 phycobiliprotein lyase [Aphanothece hegewaldii CCALA 016]
MQLISPMTMMDFFRKSEGVWYSTRTVHHFDSVSDESGESNLMVTVLEKDDPRVIEVCQAQNVDPTLVSGGASFSWLSNMDNEEPNPNYAAILVDVPNLDDPKQGKFLRNKGYVEGIPVIGVYHFDENGVLTIDTEYERNQGQERSWFVTDDFRIRVMTVKMMNGVNQMAYCSERRCVTSSSLEAMLEQNRTRASV